MRKIRMGKSQAILESLRPLQWTKNLFIFAGILFSRNILNPVLLSKVIASFFIFSFFTGSVYILNDIIDLEEDKRDPLKSRRPIASGRLKKSNAIAAGVVILPFSLGLAYWLDMPFFATMLLYFLLQLIYSLLLKHIFILDVFAIACGFLLRVIAGAVIIDVEVSPWLLICTIFLSLFLALGKRRHEVVTSEERAQNHNKTIGKYNIYLLDQMIFVVGASTLVVYVLYTLSAETISKFGTRNLIFTAPFVFYGIFRYFYLIYQKGAGGNPENILIKDMPLLADIILWIFAAGIILYAC